MADAAYKTPKTLPELQESLGGMHGRIKTLEEGIAERDKTIATATSELAELKTKAANQPDYSRIVGGVVGGFGQDTKPYSIAKAVRFAPLSHVTEPFDSLRRYLYWNAVPLGSGTDAFHTG